MSRMSNRKMCREMDDVYAAARRLKKMTKHLRKDADHVMNGSGDGAMDAAADFINHGRSKALDLAAMTGKQVRKHPAAATAIAAAAVALIGVAVARREHA